MSEPTAIAGLPDPAATTGAELERAVAELAAGRERWVAVDLRGRERYLRAALAGVQRAAEDWVAEANRRHGIPHGTPLAGEEWFSGPLVTLRALRLYAKAMCAGGQPRLPGGLRRRPDGRQVAGVFPPGPLDRFLYYRITAETWIEPDRPATQGRIYRERAAGHPAPGRVALVLGAGNVSSIAPLDVLYKLFAEDQVAVLKMNPVNEWLGPYLERAFADLIRDGFLRVVYGGAEVGDRLCRDPGVETIHLTGSHHTYEAIVWGADEDERRRRRAAGEPRVDKPITAELGSVTPVLVVPGPWSDDDVDFQARHVAAMVAHNASFNCNAAQLVVLARGWPRRQAFLERLREALAATPPRRAYYPGAQERYAAFLRRYPRAEPLGRGGPGVVPWTLIPDVQPSAEEYALREEAFCGVLGEVAIDAGDAEAFLEHAVTLANDAIRGTLSCCLLVDPATAERHRDALDRSLATLRYGCIAVNLWSGIGFGLPEATWGAHPVEPGSESFSGDGVVHNALLLDHPQKSIVRAPFRLRPKPVWFADHAALHRLGPRMARFEGDRAPWRLPGIAWLGLRG